MFLSVDSCVSFFDLPFDVYLAFYVFCLYLCGYKANELRYGKIEARHNS